MSAAAPHGALRNTRTTFGPLDNWMEYALLLILILMTGGVAELWVRLGARR